MSTKKTITILSISGIAIAAILGVVAYRTVRAATNPSPNALRSAFGQQLSGSFGAPNLDGAVGMENGGPDHPWRGTGGYTDQDLANALGITAADLNAAYENAKTAAIDQALEKGLITQAQADQLKSNRAAFPFGDWWGGWMTQNGIEFDALLAQALGITPEKLQAAQTQAFEARIDQAVADGNLSQEQANLMKGQHALFSNEGFRTSMQNSYKAAVQKAVTEGVITQAQADAILLEKGSMNFPGFPGPDGWGGERGIGRHGGFGMQKPGNPPSSTP